MSFQNDESGDVHCPETEDTPLPMKLVKTENSKSPSKALVVVETETPGPSGTQRQRSTKSHICSRCSKTFARLPDLERHLLHHSQIRNFACPKCPVRFTQKVHLKRHIEAKHLKHEADKLPSIPCSSCPKTFRTSWELARHRSAKHRFAENLYRCRYCSAKFDDRNTYVNHLDYHNGLKNFSCPSCSRAFRRKTELEKHIAARHGFGTYYKCKKCELEFSQRTQIDRHIFKNHGASNEEDKSNCDGLADLRAADETQLRRRAFTCIYCKYQRIKCRFPDKPALLSHYDEEHFTQIFKSPTKDKQQKPNVVERSDSEFVQPTVKSKPKEIFTTVDVQLILKITIQSLKSNDSSKSVSILKLNKKYLPQDFILPWRRRTVDDGQNTIGGEASGEQYFELDLNSYKCKEGETILIQTEAKKVVMQGLTNADREIPVMRLDKDQDCAVHSGAVFMIEVNYVES